MKKTLLTTLGLACMTAAIAQQVPSPSWTITQNASFSITSAGIKFIDAVDINTVWVTPTHTEWQTWKGLMEILHGFLLI